MPFSAFSIAPKSKPSASGGGGGGGGGGTVLGKWYPGHYIKLEQSTVFNTDGSFKTANLNTIFNNELKNTFCLRGIKFVISWGDIENVANADPATWNWSTVDEFVQRLYAIRQGANPKYARVLFALNYRSDTAAASGKLEIVPPDLTAKTWAWSQSGTAAQGWYINLWDSVIQARLKTFLQAFADHVVPGTDGKTLDQGDYFAGMATLESAIRPAYQNNYNGGSLALFQSGIIKSFASGDSLIKSMKTAFPNTPVQFGGNYTRAFMATAMPLLNGAKVGLNTPNGNLSTGLNDTGAPQSILVYAQNPTYYNGIMLQIEAQGDDYKASTGIDARSNKAALYDIPPYYSATGYDLLNRWRNVLHTHYMIWQRNEPFWSGGNFTEDGINFGTVPSILTFMQTNSILNNPADPAGGLNSTPPTNWL